MVILAIETSCDDTAVAILEKKGKQLKILSNIVSSQVKLHAKHGGIWPFLAKREHQKNLPVIFKRAMKMAKNPKIDAMAVTEGPGLEPCLWVGINFAKDLAKKLKTPLMPINHIEGHIMANFIENDSASIKFPVVCLIVSGGHTQLILMKDWLKYKKIGETRDDAAGECFDKTARILGLGYPGGPAISKMAKHNKAKITLPRPMINQDNYDFSFSGLKTAVLYNYKSQAKKSKTYIESMCFEIQQSIIDVLLKKTIKAARHYKAKTILLGGGVVANKELRKQFKLKLKAIMPKPSFCTDNAAMIGTAAFLHKKTKRKIEAKANLEL
ncbi:MAG: tRNA (adenosine(37)-N6)-threonylcarbamoyltransferase complex transferase subunit TsaD [Candidatus Nealsonbacteria bacterium]|nr:tRNA (adenosine(37)-N6)-threonylcarbamoyltransferase complex transferase subunit TsaD [Candidatus Nealsonbacteria bacterium]